MTCLFWTAFLVKLFILCSKSKWVEVLWAKNMNSLAYFCFFYGFQCAKINMLERQGLCNMYLLCALYEARLIATATCHRALWKEQREIKSGHGAEFDSFYFWSCSPAGVCGCSQLTCCHVETNHWTLRSFWQRFKKQGSWLLGLGRPTHELSGSVCVLSPGWVLVQITALFFRPFPHFREHWNEGIWPWNTSSCISPQPTVEY